MGKGTVLTIIADARVVTPNSVYDNGYVAVCGDRIVAAGSGQAHLDELTAALAPDAVETVDGTGLTALPGFIDMHVHGGGGSDFMNADIPSLLNACRTHAAGGTTRLLATTLSAKEPELMAALETIGEATSLPTGEWPGSGVLGAHVEGPFINCRFKGAQPPEAIRPVDLAEIRRMMDRSKGTIRLMTLAPELPGALEAAIYLRSCGTVPVIGHTGATYEQAIKAIEAGMTNTTHVMNGMQGLHHREPGVLGAVLESDEATVQLIADGLHIHPAVVRIIIRSKGFQSVALITDAMEAVGLPEGTYELGSRKVRVRNGLCTLEDGTIASSTLTMNKAVRNVIGFGAATLREASFMASLVPARILGMQNDLGSLEPGKLADIVLMNDRFDVRMTMVGGVRVYEAPQAMTVTP